MMARRPSSETVCRLKSALTTQITICTILCLANNLEAYQLEANVQTDQVGASARAAPVRYELKFQNELDNSTVIKQLAQQQVFKCQVRLAPLSQAAALASINNQARRLKSNSSLLSNEEAEQKYSKLVQELHNDQLNKLLLSSEADLRQQHQMKLFVNVTYFSIDWLKDGQSIWAAFRDEPVAIVNVTLKTQRNIDKMAARQAKSRIEIKNTLNGQQMKLTSRLRLGQLMRTDSGEYKCIARVAFLRRRQQFSPGPGWPVEFVEQSLESVGPNLIVVASNSNATTNRNEVPSNSSQQNRPKERQATKNQEVAPHSRGPTGGYDNEVKDRKTETGLVRPQFQPDDTQDDDSLIQSERSEMHNRLGGSVTATGSNLSPLFEDDEDLFRLDSGEFINKENHHQQQQQLTTNDNASPKDHQQVGANNPTDTTNRHANDLLVNSQQIPREQQHEAYLDWILDGGDDPVGMNSLVPGGDGGGNNGPTTTSTLTNEQAKRESLSLSQRQSQPNQTANRFGDKKIDDQTGPNADGSKLSEASSHLGHWPTDQGQELSAAGQPMRPSPTFNHRHGDHAPTLSTWPMTHHPDGRQRQFPHPADPIATRSKLAKFVHRIVPEPSCYTGLGEHYRGNVSISFDQRPCLNWIQVRVALSTSQMKPISISQNQTTSTLGVLAGRSVTRPPSDDNHNYCRNPNSDHRGPWCFVLYSEELDGALVRRPYQTANGQQWKSATSKQRVVRVGLDSGQLFVVAQCQLASCSEYLWLYVVAPPLGLLMLLTCLVSILIRSIRKSHYNAIFSAAYQRHNDSTSKSNNGLLCKFMQSRKRLVIDGSGLTSQKRKETGCCGLRASLPFVASLSSSSSSSSPKKPRKIGTRGKYLDEDIFEVVDDIDWSDGQQTTTTSQSMSPSESFKLHPTPTTCDDQYLNNQHTNNSPSGNWHHRSTLTHSKSINPMYDGYQAMAALDLPLSHKFQQQSSSSNNSVGTNKMSKSKSQAGPMFATLRCHVRNAHQQQQQRRLHEANSANLSQLAKKSSSFIADNNLITVHQRDALKKLETTCDRASPSVTSNLSSLQTAAEAISDHSIASTAKTGLLLSCGSSSSANSSIGGIATAPTVTSSQANNKTVGCLSEKYTLASELPRLDASSVTLAYDTQPIYEGKFSQVQMAYIKQRKDDLAQATGRIGAQVAVCSLKQQAALDESVYYATNLRLRNLNHLNILKLLGYVQLDNDDSQPKGSSCNESSTVRTNVKCSLVYDMAHMIDLTDWLKEQCKDTFDTQAHDSDLSLRQNLTCLAKQIALALDYLHDKNIIYKDLACRNCFLDVTRMLVKLASFNIEPEFNAQEDNGTGGDRSGHYYNITGDADSDLISKKLSLKSMVRPKYLLDYYVIDSRPAECQLLPLSWISLESILFNKFNKHTDIWSFGCLLYELFSLGEVAYFGYSSKQVIDSVRSNLMPPQPLLCPNGIYKLMCKCLSDIPTLRPNIKHVYEQLNLYSGQCSSFLNHHLCII